MGKFPFERSVTSTKHGKARAENKFRSYLKKNERRYSNQLYLLKKDQNTRKAWSQTSKVLNCLR